MGGLQHFSASPRPLGFGVLGFGAKGLGLTIHDHKMSPFGNKDPSNLDIRTLDLVLCLSNQGLVTDCQNPKHSLLEDLRSL